MLSDIFEGSCLHFSLRTQVSFSLSGQVAFAPSQQGLSLPGLFASASDFQCSVQVQAKTHMCHMHVHMVWMHMRTHHTTCMLQWT